MTPNATNEYLRTKVMTASPEQLQLMLYEGAIRFTRQGREALAEGRLDVSCEKLLRAQKIVMEMNASLRYDIDMPLCQKLSSLYVYIYRRLVAANVSHDLAAADEAVDLLEFQRQTWLMLMDKLTETGEPRNLTAGHVGGEPVLQAAGVNEPGGVDVAG